MKRIISLFILLSFCLMSNCYAYNNTIVIGPDGQARYEDEEDDYVNEIYSKSNYYNQSMQNNQPAQVIEYNPTRQTIQHGQAVQTSNYNQPIQNSNSYPNPYMQNNQYGQTNNTYIQPTLNGKVTRLGKGETINVFLQNEVSTKDVMLGEDLIAVVSQDWIINGNVIAEAGSVVYGTVSNANPAKGWSKDASLQMNFYKIETPDGKIYDITAEKIDIEVEKDKFGWGKTLLKGVGVIAVGAFIGAAIAYGSSSSTSTKTETNGKTTTKTTSTTVSDNAGRNSAIGAGIGAAIALGYHLTVAAKAKGDDITIPANTPFEVVLTDNITIEQ